MRFFSRLPQRPSIPACAICWLTCLLGACAHSPITAPRSSDMPPAINVNGVMVGSANRQPLYTYDGDGPLQSNCLDTCTKQWLPFYASAHDVNRGDFSVFTRQDGRRQWALVGKPLYFWAEELHPEQQAGARTDPHWEVFNVQPLLAR